MPNTAYIVVGLYDLKALNRVWIIFNSNASVASFREIFELLWNQPVGERALSEEEVKEYLESVLNEVRLIPMLTYLYSNFPVK